MKLKDFIKTILVDINAGIKEAEKQTHVRTWLQVSEGNKGIEFDVAVTASSEGHGRAGAEISVVSIGAIGAKADAKIANEEVSRVKFTIVSQLDTHPPPAIPGGSISAIQKKFKRDKQQS